jgi:predicted O-linked N-acetylglucosamine transferase (SPINDLY family)
MATIFEALAYAKAYHRAGQLEQAEELYREILRQDPANAEASYLLGAACQALGKLDEAAAHLRQAVRLRPDHVEAHNHLGVALAQQGKLDEAIANFEQALRLRPDFIEARNNLRKALLDSGRSKSSAVAPQAITLDVGAAVAHSNRGAALAQQGKLDEAVACYRQALALRPDYAEAHNNLGAALRQQGKLDEAVASFRRAVELKPDYAGAHSNLGVALSEQGQPDEAVACYQRALALRPDFAGVYNNLGLTLQSQGKLDEAVACHRRALELEPDDAQWHNNLGLAWHAQGRLGEALACYRRALELKPDHARACNNLANAIKGQGHPDEAAAWYRRALASDPNSAALHSNYLYCEQYRPGVTPARLAASHAEWDQRHARPLRAAWKPHLNRRDPQRPLRLGFVSPYFHRHPVGHFFVRVLAALDPQQCETICYAHLLRRDELTERIQAAAGGWREVQGLADETLAEQIRAEGIDILFDLAGHTEKNRLLLFARKPAPVQITWISYEGTTGLTAMDYILADRHLIPEGAEEHYCERVLRLPEVYVCYDPPAAAPEVGPLPAWNEGRVTFGSFNNLAKINPQVVAVWADILRRLPGARLVLKYRGLNDPGTRRHYTELFAAQGIEPSRLELLSWSAYAEMLAQYNQIDIALDPFPFAGGLTTCQALWMGVPVITCPGATFAARHSLSFLASVGLTETIARDLSHYVELAVELSSDLPRLAACRAELRGRLAQSPLCDGPRLARHLMKILRAVWRQWCEATPAAADDPCPR